MKTAIFYASTYGYTADSARKLAQAIGNSADVFDLGKKKRSILRLMTA